MSKTDPPESWNDFFFRAVLPGCSDNTSPETIQFHADNARPEWIRQEKEKVEYKKELEKDAKEHERTVEKLQIEIERSKERVRRDEARKREREANEDKRMREREAADEKRDPTPAFLPADFEMPISRDVRSRHIFMPGASGNGKSTQMLHIVLKDIEERHAIAILDPKGDLIRRICALLPPERLKDCIYLDVDHPVPLDILAKSGNAEYLIKDIKNFITKGSESLVQAGPRITKLIYCLLQLQHSSFLDMEHFFTRPKRQQQILESLRRLNDQKWYEIGQELASVHPKDYQPITGRMTDFTLNPTLGVILGHPQPLLNITEAIKEKKIVLVNLAGLGEPRDIFGSIIMSLYQQSALLRASSDPRYFIPETQRPPICFYVDEFEDFQNPSFATLFSKARGLGLHTTIGVQYLGLLDTANKHSIITNAGSNIIFHQEEELDSFANKIHPYKPYRLGLLEQFQAAFKIGNQPVVFKWTKAPPPYGDAEVEKSEQVIADLIEQTQQAYGWDACDRVMKLSIDAQSSTKRMGITPPSNSTTVRHHEVNDSPQPSGPPRPKTL
jgi:hypothetical protein